MKNYVEHLNWSCHAKASKSSIKTNCLKYILPSCALVASVVITMVCETYTNKPHPDQSSSHIAFTTGGFNFMKFLILSIIFDKDNLIGRGSIGLVNKDIFFNMDSCCC